MKVPKPETKRALLPCDTAGRPTIHHYVETRVVMLPNPDGGAAWEHIFECEVTGARRAWGTEDRRPRSWEVETN